MKKTKQKYDSLVERIKAGEQVNFGEMEETFARGFLESYLVRSSSSKANPKVRLRRIKTIIQALGVKPGVDDLSSYIEEAMSRRDWERLSNLYALSREGVPSQANLDRLALDALDSLQYRTSAYEEMKKHFPQLRFTSEMVTPYYERSLLSGNFGGIENIRNNTGIDIPPEPVTAQYARLLTSYHEKTTGAMLKLSEVTGIKPDLNKLEDAVSDAFSKREFNADELEQLNKIMRITTNVASLRLQETTMASQPRNFVWLYSNSESKLAPDTIQVNYQTLSSDGRIDELVRIADKIDVLPQGTALQASYNLLLEQGRHDQITAWQANTGTQPNFEDKTIERALQRHSTARLNEDRLNGFLRVMQNSQSGLDPAIVEKLGVSFLKRNIQTLSTPDAFQEAHNFFQRYGIEVPNVIQEMKTSYLIIEYNAKIRDVLKEHTKGGTSPTRAIKGHNLNEHNRFKKVMSGLIKEYSQKFKCSTLEEGISSQVQEIYGEYLKLAITQIDRGELPLDLNRLQSSLGVPIESSTITRSLSDCLTGVQASGKHLIEGLAKAGIIYNPTNNELDEAADKMVNRGQFCSLEKLLQTRNFTLSSRTIAGLRNAATAALIDGNVDQYDKLTNTFSIPIHEESKRRTESEIIYQLGKKPGNLNVVAQANNRLGITITATPDQLKEILDNYFSSNHHLRLKPNEIASALNQTLDSEYVSRKYLDILKKSPRNWSTQSEVQIIRSNTGIDLSEKVADLFLDYDVRDFDEKIIWMEILKKCTGYKPSFARIINLYDTAFDRGRGSKDQTRKIMEIVGPEHEASSYFIRGVAGGILELEKKLDWLKTLRWTGHRMIDFNEQDILPMYNSLGQTNLEQITSIYDTTKTLPPQEMADQLINESISKMNKNYRNSWQGLVSGLIQRGYQLNDNQRTELASSISGINDIEWLYNKLEDAQRIYKQNLSFTPEEQRQMLKVVHDSINWPTLSTVKRSVKIPYGVEALYFLSDNEVKKEAANTAAELLSKETVLQGYYYTRLAGITPNFTKDQYDLFRANLDQQISKFYKRDQTAIKELAEKWRVE